MKKGESLSLWHLLIMWYNANLIGQRLVLSYKTGQTIIDNREEYEDHKSNSSS